MAFRLPGRSASSWVGLATNLYGIRTLLLNFTSNLHLTSAYIKIREYEPFAVIGTLGSKVLRIDS